MKPNPGLMLFAAMAAMGGIDSGERGSRGYAGQPAIVERVTMSMISTRHKPRGPQTATGCLKTKRSMRLLSIV